MRMTHRLSRAARAGLFATALAALAAGAMGARADEATLPPMPKPLEEMATSNAASPQAASMEAWGRAHPDCQEWTDNCQVCVSGDKSGCSTVGVACVRVAPTCRKTKTATQPNPAPVPTPRPATPDAPAPAQAAPAPAAPPPAAPKP